MYSPQERNLATYVYREAYIFFFFTARGTEVLNFRIYCSFRRGFSWLRTKKLMPGSLIIFSDDNFETIYQAVIRDIDRDQKETMNNTYRKFGYVDVKVEFVSEQRVNPIVFYELHSQNKFVIIESKAFFEAYYHNLKILQQI